MKKIHEMDGREIIECVMDGMAYRSPENRFVFCRDIIQIAKDEVLNKDSRIMITFFDMVIAYLNEDLSKFYDKFGSIESLSNSEQELILYLIHRAEASNEKIS